MFLHAEGAGSRLLHILHFLVVALFFFSNSLKLCGWSGSLHWGNNMDH